MQEDRAFEVRIGTNQSHLVELGGKRLLAVETQFGRFSEDGGRTWGESFQIRYKRSSEKNGNLLYEDSKELMTALSSWTIASACHLSSVKIGAIYIEMLSDITEQYSHNQWKRLFFMTSEDEGRSWSKVSQIGLNAEHMQMTNSMIQLQSGRLLVPFYWFVFDYEHQEYRGEGIGHRYRGGYGSYKGHRILVESHGHSPEFSAVVVFYSDNLGKTWYSSPNNLWIWPLPSSDNSGGHSPLFEPVAVELEYNHILMFFRTVLGRLYQSESTDGGIHWSVPEPTNLASSHANCKVKIIPSTGDLVLVWNQVSAEEIKRGLNKSRMCVAISPDHGQSWKNFKTLEASALPPLGKINPPPIKAYHSLEDVGKVPIDFATFDYPDIAFVEDMVLFVYNVQEMRPINEWTDTTTILGEIDVYSKVKAVPIS